jgi:hypothetical protein
VLARILDTPKKRIAVAIAGFVILVGAVAVFALGGDDEEAAPTTTTTTTEPTTTTTEAPAPVAPLTGLTGTPADRLAKPAVVVKFDNGEPKARPQVGLNEADVVYEERVEGSVTRLMAIFHSRNATNVGPVRSARTSDIFIITPLNRPFFAWSGANPTFAGRIRQAKLVDVGYDARSGEYFRDPNRPRPSNLMLRSTATLQNLPTVGSLPPPAIFEFRKRGQGIPHLGGTQAVRVTFGGSSGSAPTEWRWNGDGWARWQRGTPHVDFNGRQVVAKNVIIQFVDYVPTDTADQFGVPIPEAKLVGEGDVWILTGGGTQKHGMVKGRWHKPRLGVRTTYTDADGNPIRLTPGRTWVVLPTAGGASVVG